MTRPPDPVRSDSRTATEAVTDRRPLQISDLYSISHVAQPTISPDGSLVVYVMGKPERDNDTLASGLWLARTDGTGAARQLTAGPGDQSPQFSADAETIAFTRLVDDVRQVFLIPSQGGDPHQLTTSECTVQEAGPPVFSPDDRRVAFTAMVNRTGRKAHDPLVVDHLNFKVDGMGVIGADRTHVHVTEIATGATRQLTDGDWHASSPAWSPDGTSLAFVAGGYGERKLRHISQIAVVDVDAEPTAPRVVGHARFVGAPVCWSPDGSKLLGVGGLAPRAAIASLVEQDIRTDATRLLAGELDRNVMPGATAYPGGAPAYTRDGSRVIFCVRDGGQTILRAVDTVSGATRSFDLGEGRVVSGLAVASQADRAVVVLGSRQRFGELVSVDLISGEAVTLTDYLTEDLPDVTLIMNQPRRFEISDGTTVHGWVLRHPDTTGAGPLLLDIHGGPHNAWTGAADTAHLYHQELAGKGWTILTLNPRGSDGYGNDFYAAIVGGWGRADERDFLEPVDELVAEGLVDSSRLAITGYSYGGFSACRLTAVTDRFAGAVAGGLVCDLPAMASSSDYGQFMAQIEFGVDRECLRELSPIAQAGRVRTPTLILHGASDVRCPLEQAERWFEALQVNGVESQMVRYPESSHSFLVNGRPSYRLDYNRRVIDWLEHYVTETKSAATATAHEEELTSTEDDDEMMTTTAPNQDRITPELQEDLHTLYKELHQMPELSMAEHATAALITERMGRLGYETFACGGTGVIALLRNGDGPTVGFRADTDGLPVGEDTGLNYASTARGSLPDGTEVPVMHACGHDTHIVSAIGAATLLANARSTWSGTLVFLFQPGEETSEGAGAMVADGLWDKTPRPEVIFAQHVVPSRAGQVELTSGPAMAMADSWRVTVQGRGGHGSQPETTIDPVVLAAHMVVRIQSIVTREVPAQKAVVVTIGSFHAGLKENIIPATAEFTVNVRNLDSDVRDDVLSALRRVIFAEAVASAAPEPAIEELYTFPELSNDPDATAALKEALVSALGAGNVVDCAPRMGSEDFGHLPDAIGVPSVYWFFGGNPDHVVDGSGPIPSNHSPFFAPVLEPTLTTGVTAAHAAILSRVGK